MRMQHCRGRKVPFVYIAFALSISLHALLLLWQVQGAAKFVRLGLAARTKPASILEAHLVMPQGGPRRVITSEKSPPKPEQDLAPSGQPARSESARVAPERVQARPAVPARPAAAAAKFVQSSAVAKIVNLHSGELWSFDRWQGVVTEGPPIRVVLSINPAGFVDKWEYLSEVPDAFKNQVALISVMIRNMEPDKTGETHARIWESELGKKDGRWVAKIYKVEP